MGTDPKEKEGSKVEYETTFVDCPKCHTCSAQKKVTKSGPAAFYTLSCSHCGHTKTSDITIQTGGTQN